ncbi:(deoxy)nucleoside triphosphate pyrophosphohydrolase [Bacillus nitratireducens]|uniref:(deoxy)nucleoside triphosphate pyrophosphohydrolase n=1 Tax=Bacillus nitratireducens TaxID=2026193 RepID=UPI001F56A876|nr:(deoxy)nucleoside triphosphate pyrophosphohydrolase [Bacillus nitratireducens]UNP78264.1 (deoxy)nucleoside triphosphate pyrophosphohydrolase [Bacillus nitratireducens]
MKKIIAVVGAVIFNENNEVLCALRSPIMQLLNYWELPDGKVDKGETPQEALVRENKEELGCLIKVQEKIQEIEHEYEDIIVHLVTYKAIIVMGRPKILEHVDLKRVSVIGLKGLNWAPADVPTVNKLY